MNQEMGLDKHRYGEKAQGTKGVRDGKQRETSGKSNKTKGLPNTGAKRKFKVHLYTFPARKLRKLGF